MDFSKMVLILLLWFGEAFAQFGFNNPFGVSKQNQPQEPNQRPNFFGLNVPMPMEETPSMRDQIGTPMEVPKLIAEAIPVTLPPPELSVLNLPTPIPELQTLILSTEPVEVFVNTILNILIKQILDFEYYGVPTRELRRDSYLTPEGTYHEESVILLHPDTKREQTITIGAESTNDGKIESTTFYSTDKSGYKPRMNVKRRGISPKLRKSMVN